MNKRIRFLGIILLAFSVLLFCEIASFAANFDSILQKWSRTYSTRGDMGDELTIVATYYSAEYIEALVQREAKKKPLDRKRGGKLQIRAAKGLAA